MDMKEDEKTENGKRRGQEKEKETTLFWLREKGKKDIPASQTKRSDGLQM
uniref:Uncharacterized protein n=1 Tax=Manihot esculenta TaxID=3983 RepID=A0A2C9VJM8_MANES